MRGGGVAAPLPHGAGAAPLRGRAGALRAASPAVTAPGRSSARAFPRLAGAGHGAAAAAASRSPVTAPAAPGTMSGSGSEESQPSQAVDDGQQEAEQDWAAAKAFYDNQVTQRVRPVSAGGPGVLSAGGR